MRYQAIILRISTSSDCRLTSLMRHHAITLRHWYGMRLCSDVIGASAAISRRQCRMIQTVCRSPVWPTWVSFHKAKV